MRLNLPDWVHYLTQTGSGILVYGLAAAFIGGVIAIYFAKYADVWASSRSEKKRQKTIEQLRAEIELLKPLRVDRDRLSILNALFILVVLGLIAAGPIVGSILRYAPLVPNALALGLAFIWGRTLYRLNSFEEYERQIEAKIRKLSKPGELDPVNHAVAIGLSTSSNVQLNTQIKTAPTSSPAQRTDEWNITEGTWQIKPSGLELMSGTPNGNASYIWRTERLRLPALIRFRATFPDGELVGLRVNLFAASPNETYSACNHLQLLIPWERGGYFADFMRGNPVRLSETAYGLKMLPGHSYLYELAITLDAVTVRVDGQIQYVLDNTSIKQYLLGMPNAGGYWGFAADGSRYEISGISVVTSG